MPLCSDDYVILAGSNPSELFSGMRTITKKIETLSMGSDLPPNEGSVPVDLLNGESSEYFDLGGGNVGGNESVVDLYPKGETVWSGDTSDDSWRDGGEESTVCVCVCVYVCVYIYTHIHIHNAHTHIHIHIW
jgi:hypothetical protein